MKVKNYIKQHRARMNFTQDDLARKIGVSRQSISAIEKGQHYPSILLSLQIAKALEMNIDVLFELIEGKRTRKKVEKKQEKKQNKNEVIVRESFIERIQKSRFE